MFPLDPRLLIDQSFAGSQNAACHQDVKANSWIFFQNAEFQFLTKTLNQSLALNSCYTNNYCTKFTSTLINACYDNN